MAEWFNENRDDLKAFAIRNAVTTVSHPFEFAKVLMQLGYEPFKPIQSKTLIFRSDYLALPNVFSYLRYIKSVDGFFGCFRGLIPRLCEANLQYYWYNKCAAQFPPPDEDDEQKEDRDRFLEYLQKLRRECISVSVATTMSYPFHVISVRAMAEFVGRENKYGSLIGSISEILNSDGFLGLFKGLYPRLISDILNVVIAGTVIYLIERYIMDDGGQITSMIGGFVANTFSYQFHLVSNNIIVNNTTLAIGNPPHAYKLYATWYDCWVTLRQNGQHGRGSSMIGRQFTGPVRRDGKEISPVDFMFGPLHPPGLGKNSDSKDSKSK